jgi:hypothetical protein
MAKAVSVVVASAYVSSSIYGASSTVNIGAVVGNPYID